MLGRGVVLAAMEVIMRPMTTRNDLNAIQDQLPWGFHDALLPRLEIEWVRMRARLDLRIPMTESQDQDRRGQLVFDDLLFCALEPPELDGARGYVATAADGLQVDCGDGHGRESFRATLPTTPAGYLLIWFFVREWNRFIHICARSVHLFWLEAETRQRAAHRKSLFPGEDIE